MERAAQRMERVAGRVEDRDPLLARGSDDAGPLLRAGHHQARVRAAPAQLGDEGPAVGLAAVEQPRQDDDVRGGRLGVEHLQGVVRGGRLAVRDEGGVAADDLGDDGPLGGLAFDDEDAELALAGHRWAVGGNEMRGHVWVERRGGVGGNETRPTTDYLGGDRRRRGRQGSSWRCGAAALSAGGDRRGGEERRLPRRCGLPMPSGRSFGPHGKNGSALLPGQVRPTGDPARPPSGAQAPFSGRRPERLPRIG